MYNKSRRDQTAEAVARQKCYIHRRGQDREAVVLCFKSTHPRNLRTFSINPFMVCEEEQLPVIEGSK